MSPNFLEYAPEDCSLSYFSSDSGLIIWSLLWDLFGFVSAWISPKDCGLATNRWFIGLSARGVDAYEVYDVVMYVLAVFISVFNIIKMLNNNIVHGFFCCYVDFFYIVNGVLYA